MGNTITRSQALKAVVTLDRPESIGQHQWVGVQRLLVAITNYYPKAHPGQERLAEDLGCDVRSIRRYVKAAQEAGLLFVVIDGGQKRFRNNLSKTNRYHIIPAVKLTPSDEDRNARKVSFGDSLRESLSVEASPSSSKKARRVRAAPARISRWKETERQVGENQDPLPANTRPLTVTPRKKRPPTVSRRAQPPWRRLAERFVGGWMEMIETTTPGDRLRNVRPLDSLAHCQRYLDAHFLGKEALTPRSPEEIVAMMTSFHSDVYRGQVRIKDGQSAWMAFTGAWGRQRSVSAADTVLANETYVAPEDR